MKTSDHPGYEILSELSEELRIINPLFEADEENEACRRLFIRVQFAFLESLSCIIRDKAMQGVLNEFEKTKSINVHEAAFLNDYSHSINSIGKIEMKGRCDVSFANHFAFGLRVLARVAEVDVQPIQGSGWDAFMKSVKIRNRITHPKSIEDIRISDADFDAVHDAVEWAHSSLAEIFEKTVVFEEERH